MSDTHDYSTAVTRQYGSGILIAAQHAHASCSACGGGQVRVPPPRVAVAVAVAAYACCRLYCIAGEVVAVVHSDETKEGAR